MGATPTSHCLGRPLSACSEVAALGQAPRLLRVLRAHETFADIDACGKETWPAVVFFSQIAALRRL